MKITHAEKKQINKSHGTKCKAKIKIIDKLVNLCSNKTAKQERQQYSSNNRRPTKNNEITMVTSNDGNKVTKPTVVNQ